MAKRSENNQLQKVWNLLEQERKEKKYKQYQNKSLFFMLLGVFVLVFLAGLSVVIGKYAGFFAFFGISSISLLDSYELTAILTFIFSLISIWIVSIYAKVSKYYDKKAEEYKTEE